MRTTLDIDPLVVEELRTRGEKERKTMGQIATELMAAAIAAEPKSEAAPFEWFSQDMEFLLDIDDKDALYRMLDGP